MTDKKNTLAASGVILVVVAFIGVQLLVNWKCTHTKQSDNTTSQAHKSGLPVSVINSNMPQDTLTGIVGGSMKHHFRETIVK